NTLSALRVIPGAGQLHAVTWRHAAFVGGAQPALRRVLVVGMQHRIGEAVPGVALVPAWGRQQAASFAPIRVAAGNLPADVLGIGEYDVERHGADLASRLEGLIHRL